jgi:hypothetical protein
MTTPRASQPVTAGPPLRASSTTALWVYPPGLPDRRHWFGRLRQRLRTYPAHGANPQYPAPYAGEQHHGHVHMVKGLRIPSRSAATGAASPTSTAAMPSPSTAAAPTMNMPTSPICPIRNNVLGGSFSNSWATAYADLMGVVPEVTNVYELQDHQDPTTATALGDGAFINRNFHSNEFEYFHSGQLARPFQPHPHLRPAPHHPANAL